MWKEHGFPELLNVIVSPHKIVVGGLPPYIFNLAESIFIQGRDLCTLDGGISSIGDSVTI